jgi:hypothetical protein
MTFYCKVYKRKWRIKVTKVKFFFPFHFLPCRKAKIKKPNPIIHRFLDCQMARRGGEEEEGKLLGENGSIKQGVQGILAGLTRRTGSPAGPFIIGGHGHKDVPVHQPLTHPKKEEANPYT